MLSTRVAVKRVLLGRPRASRQLGHQLLPKRIALPVLGANPLSSLAYASQELLLALAVAGAAALALATPVALAVALLVVVVVAGYRQVVRAYPHGGGAYVAAKDNLGEGPGLVAAAALLVDYPLTVAVSIAAAVAAAVSAFPELADHRTALALGALVVVTLGNVRGEREARQLLAVPAYAFVLVLGALVITGVVRCGLGIGGCPEAASAGTALPAAQALSIALVLPAFALGAVALAGVETAANGVPTLRYPQSRHAATMLATIGALAVVLFLGVTWLARATGVVPGAERTVLAEIAVALFGGGFGLLLVQVVAAAVLLVAANGAYADFPRLAAVLARDRFLPRQFLARGDHLLFTNAILLLALAAAVLLVIARASVTALVVLYVVSVFIPLALSHAGMVRRHLRLREPRWRASATLQVAGTAGCGLVAVVAVSTRFLDGVWAVLVAIPLLVSLMHATRRRYQAIGLRLRVGISEPPEPRPHHAVILLDRVDEAAARSLSYALTTRAASIRALGVPLPGTDLEARWAALAADVPLEILQPAQDPGTAEALARALVAEADRHGPGSFTCAVIPETLSRSWIDQLRAHRLALRVKARLHETGLLVVSDVTSPVGGPGPYTVEEPAEHHVVVLVSAVDVPTVRALAYAEGLHATSARALAVSLDPERSTNLLAEWDDWGLATPIEVVDSPFRSLAATVRGYVRDFSPDGRHTIVTCVLPTLVPERRRDSLLHNQAAMLLRSMLLFERGVVAASVPYALRKAPVEADRDRDLAPSD